VTAVDPETAFRLVVVISSIGVLIASLELLTLTDEFADGGLFSWYVLRTTSRATLSAATARPVALALFVPVVAGGRALAALTLVLVDGNRALTAVCVWAVVAASLALYVRAPLGLDGSDQMSTITFVAVGIHAVLPGDALVGQASLWFVAVQGCLSYCVAGIAKAVSPVWRSGAAVRGIFGTRTYGTRTSAAVVRGHPGLCAAAAWFVISFEITFPLALVLGPAGVAVYAAVGALFHVSNAVLMGLNTFVWAFVATYPAVLYCAVGLQR
jgi:hypothetical protein